MGSDPEVILCIYLGEKGDPGEVRTYPGDPGQKGDKGSPGNNGSQGKTEGYCLLPLFLVFILAVKERNYLGKANTRSKKVGML